MARTWTNADGETYIHLASGEHYWLVYVEFTEPLTRRGAHEVTGTTFGVVAKTAHGAQRAALAEARKTYTQPVAWITDVRQDDGYLCAHCGLVGGH